MAKVGGGRGCDALFPVCFYYSVSNYNDVKAGEKKATEVWTG